MTGFTMCAATTSSIMEAIPSALPSLWYNDFWVTIVLVSVMALILSFKGLAGYESIS
jgi:hypothetical protein